jgi:hypothetical protein
MAKNPRPGARRPATKFPHLQKKMQKQKPPTRPARKK